MKKIKISTEEASLFIKVMEGIDKTLSFEQVQAINDQLVAYKKQYLDGKSDLVKFSVNFILILVFGLLFSINYSVLLFFPFSVGIAFFGYKILVSIKKMVTAKIGITNSEFAKKSHFNSI